MYERRRNGDGLILGPRTERRGYDELQMQMEPPPAASVCAHGSLPRSCDRCEMLDELRDLRLRDQRATAAAACWRETAQILARALIETARDGSPRVVGRVCP